MSRCPNDCIQDDRGRFVVWFNAGGKAHGFAICPVCNGAGEVESTP